MRLTKDQLKRIIHEEYSSLKRQETIRENRMLRENKSWQFNRKMGGPDKQGFKENMPIRLAVNFTLGWLDSDFGQDILLNIAEICKTREHIIRLSKDKTTVEGLALSQALETGDINKSGNYDYYAFVDEMVKQLSRMGV